MAESIEIVSIEEHSSYLGAEAASAGDVDLIVALTNGLITEKWKKPVDPIPSSVLAIGLEVAARAIRNRKGLASWTISVDDASRTERLPENAARAGVYLTNAELRTLRGRRKSGMGTIRVRPGY